MGYYESVFSKVDYRIWMTVIPLIGVLLLPAAMNVKLGIDFTGGTEIQILTDRTITAQQFETALKSCNAPDVNANVQELEGKTSAIIKSKEAISKECVDTALSGLGFTPDELKTVLPSTFRPELGKVLLEQGSKVFVIAGILMMLIVFLAFRSFIPSIAVIQAAVFDITIGLGILSLFGFELSLAGFAALLMLIGYSVDDNIVLTSNVLKSKDEPLAQQVNRAFATGITMTGTAIAAMMSIVVVAAFVQMETIMQIALVLVAGLSADFFTTWFVNVAILKWYVGRDKKSRAPRFKLSLFRS